MQGLRKWILVLRAWSFSVDFTPVTLGAVLALPQFNLGFYIAMVIGVIALNGVANVVNDIFDFEYGIDKKSDEAAEKRGHPLIVNSVSKRSLWHIVIAMAVVAALCGAYIAASRGYMVLVLGAIGAALAYFYSAGKKSLKMLGLGELAVFIVFGPLITESAYFVESGSFSLLPAAVAIPIGLLVILVHLSNNIRDIKKDRRVGIRNVVAYLGKARSTRLFSCILALVYAFVFLFIAISVIPLFSAVVVLSAYRAYRINAMVHDNIAHDAPAQLSIFALLFGLLFISGIAIGYVLG